MSNAKIFCGKMQFYAYFAINRLALTSGKEDHYPSDSLPEFRSWTPLEGAPTPLSQFSHVASALSALRYNFVSPNH